MKRQATKATQKQLAYLAHWQDPEHGGYTFGRDDVIPESTMIPPRQWYMSRWVDFAVTALAMVVIFASLYFKP